MLDIPNIDVIRATRVVLQELHMLDNGFKITAFGRDALALGLHPRYAYMILKSNEMGYGYEACLLSALLSEKSILKNSLRDSDILSAFTPLYEKDFDSHYINIFRAKEDLKQADFFYAKLKKIKNLGKNSVFEIDILAVILLLAYPDRLAKCRGKNDNRYKLSNGKGALLNIEDSLFNEE